MKMGEPVVGWIEPGPMRKEAIAVTRSAVLGALGVIVLLGVLVFAEAETWLLLVVSGVLLPYYGFLGWVAWFCWWTLKKGWGVLQARRDGDDVILGAPFGMVLGRGRRFASGDTVKLSVASRAPKGRLRSEWTIAGSRGSVMAKSPGAWTEGQWYELGQGLQRLGFAVVAEPEAAGSHAAAPGR
jgi:hypothetical protein